MEDFSQLLTLGMKNKQLQPAQRAAYMVEQILSFLQPEETQKRMKNLKICTIRFDGLVQLNI